MTTNTTRRANLASRSLPALALLLLRLKAARLCLWLARVTDLHSGPHLRLADRLVAAIERRLWGRQ